MFSIFQVKCHGDELEFASYLVQEYFSVLSIFQVKCRGDELDVTGCLVQEVCQTQEYASVICYGFLLTTGQSCTLGYY